jgi:hypothetical protein
MVAQFLVWRNLWIDKVEESHRQTLRDIAKRLQSQLVADSSPTYDDSVSWTPQHIFRAHFPALATDIASYRQALEDAAQALEAQIDAIDLAAFAEFGLNTGWYQGVVSQRCKTHLDDIIERRELDITVSSSANLVWVADVVYDGPEPQEAERRLRRWLREVAEWPEVDVYRDARARKARSQVRAIFHMDPLLHEQPIRKTRGCEICFPPREHR